MLPSMESVIAFICPVLMVPEYSVPFKFSSTSGILYAASKTYLFIGLLNNIYCFSEEDTLVGW